MLAILRRILLSPLLRLVWTGVLLAGMYAALRFVSPELLRASNTSLPGALRNAVIFTVALGLSVRFLERHRLRDVGFRLEAAVPDTVRGFALGAALLTVVVGAVALLGDYAILGWQPLPTGATRGGLFLEALVILLAAATFEEVLSRGILFRLFEQAMGTWLAIAVSAGLFALGHRSNPGATWMSAIGVAAAGVLLAAVYAATRSLWFGIALHAAWNLFEGPVFGSPVSGLSLNVLANAEFSGSELVTGGSFGLERGLPLTLLAGALSVPFLVAAVRRGQILTPAWMRWLLDRFRRPAPPLPLLPPPEPGAQAPTSDAPV